MTGHRPSADACRLTGMNADGRRRRNICVCTSLSCEVAGHPRVEKISVDPLSSRRCKQQCHAAQCVRHRSLPAVADWRQNSAFWHTVCTYVCAVYAEQGLWKGRASVCPSVRLSVCPYCSRWIESASYSRVKSDVRLYQSHTGRRRTKTHSFRWKGFDL